MSRKKAVSAKAPGGPRKSASAANLESADAPILVRQDHPDANPYYDAFEAQTAAAKHALRACRFITEGELTPRLRSGHGHDVITQDEIEALKSAFHVAAHLAYRIRRRLERGALVEDGLWCLGRDRNYEHAYDFFKDEPALWGDYSASADGAGIQVLEHIEDLGYDPARADWWPIIRGSDAPMAERGLAHPVCGTCHLPLAEFAGPGKGEHGYVCQTPGCVDDAEA